MADIRDRFQKDIYIELGLQTVNYDTLEKINRGHDLAQFIDAVLRIKRYGFNVTTHMIVKSSMGYYERYYRRGPYLISPRCGSS